MSRLACRNWPDTYLSLHEWNSQSPSVWNQYLLPLLSCAARSLQVTLHVNNACTDLPVSNRFVVVEPQIICGVMLLSACCTFCYALIDSARHSCLYAICSVGCNSKSSLWVPPQLKLHPDTSKVQRPLNSCSPPTAALSLAIPC